MTDELWRDDPMLEWLESGPSDVPVEPLEAAIAYARAHPRRRWSGAGLRRFLMDRLHLEQVHPGRSPGRWNAAVAAVAVVAVVVVAVGGVGLLSRGGTNQRDGAGPVATPTASPTPYRDPMAGDPRCIVATVAGKAGSPGNADGTGAAARFSAESGPMFIRDGLVYIVDAGNHTLRTMTMQGDVGTWAGKAGEPGYADGPANTTARFREPNFMATGADGTIYVADLGNHVIRKISDAGNFMAVTTLAGTAGEFGYRDGVGSNARFYQPWSLAVDKAGSVYVGELDGSTIRKITPDGTVTTLAGKAGEYRYGVDGPASQAGFGWPFWIGFDPQGVLHVIDVNKARTESRLRTVAADGTVTTVKANWSNSGEPGPVWYDPSGTAFVSSPLGNTLSKLTPDGTVTLLAGGLLRPGSADGTGDVARFNAPMSIMGDASGTIYVGDSGNATIRTVRCP